MTLRSFGRSLPYSTHPITTNSSQPSTRWTLPNLPRVKPSNSSTPSIRCLFPPPPPLSLTHSLTHNLQALEYDNGVQDTKSKLRRVLRKTCAEVGILPSSYYLDDRRMKRLNEVPFASGGYSDVWRGLYDGQDVSIKAFRVYTSDNIKQLTKVLFFFFIKPRRERSLTPFPSPSLGARRSWFAGTSLTRTSSLSSVSYPPNLFRSVSCHNG